MTNQSIADMLMLITLYASEKIETEEDPQLCMAVHGLMEAISRIEGISVTKH